MKSRRHTLNQSQRNAVRDWWQALQPRDEKAPPLPEWLRGLGRADRARLRRCENLDDLLSEHAALLLVKALIALNGEQGALPDNIFTYQRLAWVAGVLAIVKEPSLRDGRTLAWRLGRATDAERPAMNEQRFQRLQRTREMDDLFLQWRRAVRLAECKADVAQLADDLLRWQIDLGQTTHQASSVKFHWAHDYYLSAREQAAADESPSNQEITP
jgi:CRISPR system Cascade subunit CasB